MRDKGSMNVALSDMVDTVMKLDRENARLREALEKISEQSKYTGPNNITAQTMSDIAKRALKEGNDEG